MLHIRLLGGDLDEVQGAIAQSRIDYPLRELDSIPRNGRHYEPLKFMWFREHQRVLVCLGRNRYDFMEQQTVAYMLFHGLENCIFAALI